MDTPNAFVGKVQKPTDKELSLALGTTARLWKDLEDWLADEYGVAGREWKSISPKYGWSLRLKRKDRTIVHLSPCAGCFRVAFILGDRAVKAALAAELPGAVAKDLASARRYAEGTGVRLIVKKPTDLAAIRMLAAIKIAN